MKKLFLVLAWGAITFVPVHAAVVRAPLEFIDGTQAVSLELNGQPTQFILDTGASLPLYLPKAFAGKISQIKPGPAQRTFDLRGAVQESAGFTIDRLDLSGIDFGAVSGSYLVPSGFSVSGANKFNDRLPVLGLALFALREPPVTRTSSSGCTAQLTLPSSGGFGCESLVDSGC